MSDDIQLPELPEPDEQSMANYGIKNDCFSWDAMEDYARAAVLADRERRAQPAPGAEGWKLVPVEPTAEMVGAACDEEQRPLPMWSRMGAIYKAMLAAAPAVQGDLMLNGFRVMNLTGRPGAREGERWEVYAPCGSGGVVHEDEVAHWAVRKLLDALAAPQPAAAGEEIMVNTPYDVFTLPLQPSGLGGKGPRFVVHVPGSGQPAAPDVTALVEALERVMYCNEVKFLPEGVQQAVSDAIAAYQPAKEKPE